MAKFIREESREHGAALLSSTHTIRELFSKIECELHQPQGRGKLSKTPGWYYIAVQHHQDVDNPYDEGNIKHGFTGNRNENGVLKNEFQCSYGEATPELVELVTPYMSEGNIGSFEFIRWANGRLHIFARSRNHIGSYRVCEVLE